MFAVLRNRNYFWLWLGQTISILGDALRDWAMTFWIFRASGEDPVMLALSLIAVSAPSLFLAPIAGVLVDRWDRRRTMIIADILRGGLSLLLILVVTTELYGLALVVTFLASCIAQFFGPSRSAMVRKIVGPANLLQANSLASTTSSILALASPALATSIFFFLGPKVSFTVDAISFFLSAVCIAMVAVSGKVETPAHGRQFWPEFKEGLRFGLGSPTLRTTMIAMTLAMAGAGAINALGLLIIKQSLGMPETTMGYLSPLQTLFSLLAAITVGTAARRLKRVHMLIPVGLAFATAAIAMVAGARNIWVFAAGMPLVGVANVVLNLGASTTMQRLIPDQLMGRVSSVLHMPIVGAMLISAGVAGAIARVVDPQSIMGYSAALIALGTISAFMGLRKVELPAAPEQHAQSA